VKVRKKKLIADSSQQWERRTKGRSEKKRSLEGKKIRG
jgi:hypothetical protein